MERAQVVDSHVHFWDPAALRYPWLEETPELERAFLPPDYFRDDVGATTAVVFVEANCRAADSADEVRFVRQLMGIEPRIVGIVAFVDMLDERSRADALERLAGTPRVVGVRHNIQGHAPGFCTSSAFVNGVRAVGGMGFTFDVCATHDQLSEVEQLADRCADTVLVLDHCGKPAIRDNEFARWSEDIMHLAAHPNVSCKLSGLLTEARPERRGDEALRPYAEHVRECFGAERLLYGSDWPVVTTAGHVTAWRAFTDRFCASWLPEDRQLFYAENAIRLYGLELHAHS